MLLTAEDKKYLASIGYTEDSFKQINEAMKKCNTKYTQQGKLITREDAVRLLGRKRYLAALGRSAFHYTTEEYDSRGLTKVGFDTTAMFERK